MMFAYLKGVVRGHEGVDVVLDVHDVGYAVFVPHSYALVCGDTYAFHVVTIVREDKISLFGFKTPEEKHLFTLLLDVQGVGGKLALTMLSQCSPQAILSAIKERHYTVLESVSGVGKRLAERLVRELSDKIYKEFPFDIQSDANTIKEVYNGLSHLGYRQHDIRSLVEECLKEKPNASSEELIVDFLRKMGDK